MCICVSDWNGTETHVVEGGGQSHLAVTVTNLLCGSGMAFSRLAFDQLMRGEYSFLDVSDTRTHAHDASSAVVLATFAHVNTHTHTRQLGPLAAFQETVAVDASNCTSEKAIPRPSAHTRGGRTGGPDRHARVAAVMHVCLAVRTAYRSHPARGAVDKSRT